MFNVNYKITSSKMLVSIVCRNNFGIKEDENILFEYGVRSKKETKLVDVCKNQMILILNYYFQQFQAGPDSFLDEIRSFGGYIGLISKDKSNKNNELQELYNGLRLRVDILFTHKPVINLINPKVSYLFE